MPPDNGKVVEYPRPKRDDSGKVQLNTQPVAKERQRPGQQHIAEQTRYENLVLVSAIQLGTNGP